MQMKRSPSRDSTLSAVSARCGGGRCRSLSVVSLSLVALVFYSSWEALSQQQKQQPAQEEDREFCETAGELFTPTLSHWPLPTDVSEIVQGLGLLEESSTSSSSLDEQPAICVFERNKLSLHFPHAMQQLYACVSFWLSAPQQERPRVLEIVSPPAGSWLEGLRYRIYERRNRDNPFLASFYASLTASLGVTIVEADAASANAVRVRSMVDAWKDGYQLLPAPTAHMRQAFWDERQLSTMPVCAVPIRIGILNRQKNRSILNMESLRQAVQQHTGQQEIAVVYFEDKSFDEQLEFLSQTDILISPHGAQLTGIPFMPPCGGVLEIFPENYWIPHFFGSLAAGSGLAHSHVYLGKPNETPEMVEVAMEEHKNLRAVARQVDLCPALATVLQGLDILTQERRRCCSAH